MNVPALLAGLSHCGPSALNVGGALPRRRYADYVPGARGERMKDE